MARPNRLLFAVCGQVFFTADDGQHGRELWRSDSTADGTVVIKDINPGPHQSKVTLSDTATVVDELLFFTADDGVGGERLYRSDGTPAGTFALGLRIDQPGAASGGLFIFRNAVDGTLWRTDGTRK